ncbi:MAG: glycoside hydrolase family 66 protein [Chthoniobacterales bacterium]
MHSLRLSAVIFLACVSLARADLYWVGNSHSNAVNGVIASTQDFKVVAETFPVAAGNSVRVTYTTNGGASWQSASLDFHRNAGQNALWQKNLGTFPRGTTIRYAIQATGPNATKQDNNNGSDYYVNVNDTTATIRWLGNTSTYPDYGLVDPEKDFWVNTETWPVGVAASATLVYSTNDGASWSEAAMSRNGSSNGNDAWHAKIGGFPAGTTVRYYIRAKNASAATYWESNNGADYFVRVNSPLRDVYPDKGRFNPGEVATIKADLYNATNDAVTGVVKVSVKQLTDEIASFQQNIILPAGSGQTLSFPWTTRGNDFRGYTVDVDFVVGGQVVDTRSSALDVSSEWVKFPRYGFYSDYYQGDDYNGKAAELAKYHINVVQFYDWMWTHDRLVPYWNGQVADIFTQVDGRVQSFNTVKNKVAASKSRNMASMAYSLLYGDSGNNAAPEHKEWAAYQEKWSTNTADIEKHDAGYTIWKMDVTNSDWKNHIFGEFRDAISKAGFDGVHLDNLGGSWLYKYNSDQGIPEWTGFADFINGARASIRTVNSNARVTHNDVAAGYLDNIARSDADAYYAEVWGYDNYNDIRGLINRARAAGGGKQVVLAAYINRKSWDELSDPVATPQPTYINDASAKLMDACVFANGAFHLELGDGGDMLVNEYFPLRSPRMHPALKRSMRDYYDFAVRYENFLFYNTLGNVSDGTDGMNVWSGTHALSKDGRSGTIWTIAKVWRDEYDALNLVNLNGVDTQWRNTTGNPAPQSNILLKYYVDKKAQRVLLATPDDGLGRAVELSFTEGTDDVGYYVTFTVPSLKFWDLVIIDKTSRIKTDGWPGDWQGSASSQVHASAVSSGEWIYKGENNDHRTFAGATADSDLSEVRVTSDNTYVYFLLRMQRIDDATLPAIGIALDTDQNTSAGAGQVWIGDASTPTGSIALGSATQNAEKQIMLYVDGSGQPVIRIFDGQWHGPPSPDSAISYSAANRTIEVRINKNDLGIDYPQRITMSLATFRSSRSDAGSDATFDSPDSNNDAIDVMGGDVGVSANAWARDLSDNRIDRYQQFVLDHDGAKAVWLGNVWHYPADNNIDASNDFWLNVDVWPPGKATNVAASYSINGGAWVSQALTGNGQTGIFSNLHLSLGKFNPGTTIQYAFRATDADGNVIWNSNAGENYTAQVNSTAKDTDGDGMANWWMLAQFGHSDPRSGDQSRAGDDADWDGRTNLGECIASTNAKNAASRLAITSVAMQANGNVLIIWSSVTGKVYQVQAASKPEGPYQPLSGAINSSGATTSYSDYQPEGDKFYKVVVLQ